MENKKLKEIYHQIIDCLNQKDYQEAKYQIGEATEIINYELLPIDFQIIVKIIEQIEKKIAEKVPMLLSTNLNTETRYNIIQVVYQNKLLPYETILQEINQVIEGNLKLGTKLLNQVKFDPKEAEYRLEIQYLKSKAKEKEDYNSLSEKDKEIYKNIITKAKQALNEKDYIRAYREYTEGKEILGLSIFDYYIGKALYKMKKFDSSKISLLNYIATGGEKSSKALLYIDCVYHIEKEEMNEKDIQKIIDIASTIDRLNKLERNEFILSSSIKPSKPNDFKIKKEEIVNMYKNDEQTADEILEEIEKNCTSNIQKRKVQCVTRNKK